MSSTHKSIVWEYTTLSAFQLQIQLPMWEFNSAIENLYQWIEFLHLVNFMAITALIKPSG
jgi:hypothetical protein